MPGPSLRMGDSFVLAMVLKCVNKWRLASEDQEILEAQERQLMMFKL